MSFTAGLLQNFSDAYVDRQERDARNARLEEGRGAYTPNSTPPIIDDGRGRGARPAPVPYSAEHDIDAGDPRRAAGGQPTGPTETRRGSRGGLFGLTHKYESAGGGYDTLFGHQQRPGGDFEGVRVSQMTIGQLRDFANPRGAYAQDVKGDLARAGKWSRVATPMGAHQIVGTTLFRAAEQLGLSDDTVFDAKTQDRIAEHLARQRISGQRTMKGKIAALRQEWEAFETVPDAELAMAINEFEGAGRGAY
ncbi:hypothetical protein [uncultured Roseobacter sp.]|uniref:hypothetical protein n=1 Tax=uncultured Roseobacter sp. TaxID=114847 RepID=UPI00260D11D0|nr:hypothetical protein [uncultured Roseobacter sp.]